jgi:hypothetical protein
MRTSVIHFAILFLAFVVPYSAQVLTEKDRKVLDDLERDVRKDLDKELARFKPLPLPVRPDASQPTRAGLQSSYDKFKDSTIVSIVSPIHDLNPANRIRNSKLEGYIAYVDLLAAFSYEGQQPRKPSSIDLAFKVMASSPLFGSNPTFIVIADNKRFRLGNMSQAITRVSLRSIEEFTSISVPLSTFSEIADANSVEVQIGNIDFPLSEDNLRSLRMISGLPDRPSKQIDPSSDRSFVERPKRFSGGPRTNWQLVLARKT